MPNLASSTCTVNSSRFAYALLDGTTRLLDAMALEGTDRDKYLRSAKANLYAAGNRAETSEETALVNSLQKVLSYMGAEADE